MKIELSKKTEEAIGKGLSSGQFSTAEAFLEAAAGDLAERLQPSSTSEMLDERSLFERLSEHGIIGACKGPSDLSTNPEYMDGFGR